MISSALMVSAALWGIACCWICSLAAYGCHEDPVPVWYATTSQCTIAYKHGQPCYGCVLHLAAGLHECCAYKHMSFLQFSFVPMLAATRYISSGRFCNVCCLLVWHEFCHRQHGWKWASLAIRSDVRLLSCLEILLLRCLGCKRFYAGLTCECEFAMLAIWSICCGPCIAQSNRVRFTSNIATYFVTDQIGIMIASIIKVSSGHHNHFCVFFFFFFFFFWFQGDFPPLSRWQRYRKHLICARTTPQKKCP